MVTSISYLTSRAPLGLTTHSLPPVPDALNKRSFRGPTETVYETFGVEDGVNTCSFAFVDLTQSEEHFHTERDESYIVIGGGALRVCINGIPQIVQPGESVWIPRGARHVAESVNGEPVRLAVPCIPAWIYQDSHPTSKETPTCIPRSTSPITILPRIEGELGSLAKHLGHKTIYPFVQPEHQMNCTAALLDLPAEDFLSASCPNTLEYTVVAGKLKTVVADKHRVLHAGEALSVPKDILHVLEADGGPVRLCVMSVSQSSIEKLLKL